jgi:hypothetical protein
MGEVMLERISTIVALAVICAGVAFGAYQYREVHLPAFEQLKATVEYQQCIQRCIDTCKANGILVDKCKCGHCDVYRRF